ncbi:MAG: SMEK domain-containing protein [Paludibacteraceae bacterium]|nr:SMEK domain-containing protein [Paludibacteraceae bacterium]
MNRSLYFNYIEEKLGILAYRINLKGQLNILDLHIHSENFYANLLNTINGWHLENLNPFKQNVEAIDLIDHSNKLIIQVSATNTKSKVESALAKDSLKSYSNYTFKFISISKEATDLRKSTFANPHSIKFNSNTDILDNKSVLNSVLSLETDKQKAVYNLIRKELGNEIDFVKLDSNLALIINILSKQDLRVSNSETINPFEIERKIAHNEIKLTKSIINQYAIYHPRLDKKYTEFDNSGSNKSLSILQMINSIYIDSCVNFKEKDSDFIFLRVIESVKDKVLNSANYVTIPIDELELCVNIIVVDAFIRCKIFENPQDYNYALT